MDNQIKNVYNIHRHIITFKSGDKISTFQHIELGRYISLQTNIIYPSFDEIPNVENINNKLD